jgi:hypothetical protein
MQQAVARISVYRRGAIWRYALWVGEAKFNAGALPVEGDDWQEAALRLARGRYPDVDRVAVSRGIDLPEN